MEHLVTLRDEVLGSTPERHFAVSLRPAPDRSEDEKRAKPNPYRDSKIVVAYKHLDGQRWLVKGYTDAPGWALGIKSLPHEQGRLDELCAVAAHILNAWLAAEQAT